MTFGGIVVSSGKSVIEVNLQLTKLIPKTLIVKNSENLSFDSAVESVTFK